MKIISKNRKYNASQLIRTFVSALFLATAYLVFTTSCADQGIGPTGGPKDSIPPVVVNMIPSNLQTQFAGRDVEISFNEYVVADNLTEKLIVSPPLGKKPTVKMKGKAVLVKVEEDLIPDRTYSFDFGDGIKDNNEGNKLDKLRLIFSTGKNIDTLRVSGTIYNAATLEPEPNVIAALYSIDSDSLFMSFHPDFIARTDDKGEFLFDNLPQQEFKLFALKDGDKNLFFSNVSELIAFSDTMITPTVHFVEKIDTIITGKDTTVIEGYYEFLPKGLDLFLFQDFSFNQYLVSSKRETSDKFVLVFNEAVTDSLQMTFVGYDSLTVPRVIEYSHSLDTVSLWITDSIFAAKDSLFMRLSYMASDSTGELVAQIDTLKMFYNKPVQPQGKPGKEKPVQAGNYFRFTNNLNSSGFDLNSKLIIEAPSPIQNPEKLSFNLKELLTDSTSAIVEHTLIPLSASKRKFQIDFQLKENTKYELSIDTAVVKTYTGIPNAGFTSKFSTQKKENYGTLILSLSGIDHSGIVMLIKNGKEESIIRKTPFQPGMKPIVFDYLKPDKYLVKFISDLNDNGEWDTGNLLLKQQPEPVYYLQKEITIKPNWEMKESWEIEQGKILGKSFASQSDKKKSGKKE